MQKNWNYTQYDGVEKRKSNFKEMIEFIKRNFTGKIKVHDITNNSVKIINECIFEDKGSYAIFYTVDEGCVIIYSMVLLNEFFVYSYGVDKE